MTGVSTRSRDWVEQRSTTTLRPPSLLRRAGGMTEGEDSDVVEMVEILARSRHSGPQKTRASGRDDKEGDILLRRGRGAVDHYVAARLRRRALHKQEKPRCPAEARHVQNRSVTAVAWGKSELRCGGRRVPARQFRRECDRAGCGTPECAEYRQKARADKHQQWI
jgi:hypothetical protein